MTQALLSLTLPEHQRLDALEDVIDQGRQAFIEVGSALLEIRDSKLYRQDFNTFEDYCRDRWQFSRFTAYDLIKATEVVGVLTTVNKALGPVTDVLPPLPTNEAQTRELAPLRKEPEVMREVWRESVEVSGGQPTAAVVRDVREQVVAAKAAVRAGIREMAHASNAALEEAASHLSPETRRLLEPEMMRQRGEVMRLVTDLSHLDDATKFANVHHSLVNDAMVANARTARHWIEQFLTAMEAYR